MAINPHATGRQLGAYKSAAKKTGLSVMDKIAFHHKQNGGLRGKDGGCLVDGIEHKAFPEALQ